MSGMARLPILPVSPNSFSCFFGEVLGSTFLIIFICVLGCVLGCAIVSGMNRRATLRVWPHTPCLAALDIAVSTSHGMGCFRAHTRGVVDIHHVIANNYE